MASIIMFQCWKRDCQGHLDIEPIPSDPAHFRGKCDACGARVSNMTKMKPMTFIKQKTTEEIDYE